MQKLSSSRVKSLVEHYAPSLSLCALLWAAYFLVALSSVLLARATTGVAPFWLPVAVLLAAMILQPRARWAVILMLGVTAGAAANLLLGTALPTIAVHGFLNAIGPFIVALGVNRATKGVWRFSARSLRDFAALALLSSALLATVGSGWRYVLDGSPAAQVWPEWFVSNALGFLVGTPFILAWAEPALRPRLTGALLAETGLLAAIVGAITFVAFTSSLPLLFIVFPVLALVTARRGLAGATTGVVAFTSVTLWCMIARIGPIAELPTASLFMKMLVLRAYLLTGVLATLPVAIFLALRELLHRTLDSMIQGLAMFDRHNRLIICNRRFAELYRLPPHLTARGTGLTEMVLGDGRPLMRPPAQRSPSCAEMVTDRSQSELPDERVIEIQYRMLPGKAWISTHEDVTEKRIADRRIAHLANHDPLTELANRTAFRNELDRHVAALASGERFAIHALDLDRFKAVNDTLGHAAGDDLLRQVAQRLREETRNSDFIARLGGDEFAIIQAPIGSLEEANSLASRVVEALSWPFEIDGREATIGASIGIAHAPLHGHDQAELLQKSDIALYRSKSDGRNRFCTYEAGMDVLLQERRALETELRAAIQRGQFLVEYQPLIDVESGRVSTVEALVRWKHPRRGLLQPDAFIPLAEETGLIGPIGEWVLRQSCYEAATWPENVKLAVNFSPTQFRAGNVVELIMSALTSAKLSPERLEIEITESLLLDNNEETLAVLNELHALGVRIAMDDFGTGYSSLSYLRNFPFDKIKIDQTFVKDIGSNDEAIAIVNATTQLSHQLGLRTTAEGVETFEQLEILKRQGCTEVQGFYFSGPVGSDAMRAILAEGAGRMPIGGAKPKEAAARASGIAA